MKPRSAVRWSSAALLVLCAAAASSFELREDGGYKILVAVDNDVAEPPAAEIADFIADIKNGLQKFSHDLFIASDNYFHLAEAEVLLPSNWTVAGTAAATDFHSIASSQVRLSGAPETLPFVDNPHPCHLPGKFIQLPANFFQNPAGIDGPYGNPGKALLTQWARYRYGVWEEHGYPTPNHPFPYFYANEQNVWEPSTCADAVTVNGDYETVGENPVACPMDSITRPGQDCRFKPNAITNAHVTSSLMSYHWLDSVTRFCDELTHNKFAPNRQNLFCDNKSVMQVIRETQDYSVVTQPPTSTPPLTFKTLQHKAEQPSKPALYILLDHARLVVGSTEHQVLSSLVTALAPRLFDTGIAGSLPSDVNIAAGAFPAELGIMSTQHAFRVLGDDPEGYRGDLIDFLASAVEFDGDEERDFASALAEVTKEVETFAPQNGALVLVVKTGAPAQDYFESSIPYEAEVGTALHKNNIKVFAVEIDAATDTTTHLATIASRTGGVHRALTALDAVPAAVEAIVTGISTALGAPGVKETILTIHRSVVDPDVTVTVPLVHEADVSVTMVVPYNPEARLVVTLSGGDQEIIPTFPEWNVDFRHVFVFEHPYNAAETSLGLKYTCTAAQHCADTQAFLFVTETFPEGAASRELPEAVRVKVSSASRPETSIDFNTTSVAYAINAKVELDGKAVRDAIVRGVASYTPPTGGGVVNIPLILLDDGLGAPDAIKNDGIYSASFVPPADATYTVSVSVENGPLPPPPTTRLISQDQSSFGCEGACDAVALSQVVQILDVQLPSLTFRNFESYPNFGFPEKIFDFQVSRDDALTGVIYTFTSPKIIGRSGEKATRYLVRTAVSHAALLPGGAGGVNAGNFNDISDPGAVETFELATVASDWNYYTITAFFGNNESIQSKVVRIAPMEEPVEPEGTTTAAPPNEGTTTGPTTAAPPKTETPFFETPGGIVLIVFLVLLGVGAAGGGFWWYRKRSSGNGYTHGV